jgi:hypothetical protein
MACHSARKNKTVWLVKVENACGLENGWLLFGALWFALSSLAVSKNLTASRRACEGKSNEAGQSGQQCVAAEA